MMILIQCSTDGYDLIAESRSRGYLERLREVEQQFEGLSIDEFIYESTRTGDSYEPVEEDFSIDDPAMFEDHSQFLIIPRSIVGRRGDMSTIEALREKFPLPSMLRQRLAELNQL